MGRVLICELQIMSFGIHDASLWVVLGPGCNAASPSSRINLATCLRFTQIPYLSKIASRNFQEPLNGYSRYISSISLISFSFSRDSSLRR